MFTFALQESELRRENDATAERLVQEGLAAHQPLAVPSQYAASYRVQRRVLLRKFMMVYYRSPHYNFIRLFMTAVIALIYGAGKPAGWVSLPLCHAVVAAPGACPLISNEKSPDSTCGLSLKLGSLTRSLFFPLSC